jgi:hypothetical protein
MLSAASLWFETTVKKGTPTAGRTNVCVERVVGPLKTTVTLLEEGKLRVCLVCGPWLTYAESVNQPLRDAVSADLKIPKSHVVTFSSHDHCVPVMSENPHSIWSIPSGTPFNAKLLGLGREWILQVRQTAKKLVRRLQPVSVWYAVGKENRITYNRKGRRADGSTYLMREEDRLKLGKDFRGRIDPDAPVVCLKNAQGRPVVFLVQFTGHPVTAYHPEHPIAFGEWPQVACELLSRRYSTRPAIPVAFLQGCAGNINSKGMLSGDVERSIRYGKFLGDTYIRASKKLKPSKRTGLEYFVEKVPVPFKKLPSPAVLKKEVAEMEDFIRRAKQGDENTRFCAGLNFPHALSPRYRAALVEMILPWNYWALNLHNAGKEDRAPKYVEMEIYVLRLGDVGIVGMPCEPFTGIGRLIKDHSPLPLTIPCGYANASHGYVTDGPNTGDREYMSSFYRYTKFYPPYKKPAGDVLARYAVKTLKRFAKGK